MAEIGAPPRTIDETGPGPSSSHRKPPEEKDTDYDPEEEEDESSDSESEESDRGQHQIEEGSDGDVEGGEEDDEHIEPEGDATGLKRRRKADRSQWKRNIRKRLCQSGQAHTNTKGNDVPAKIPKPMENHVCKLSCSEFTEEEWVSVCRAYWDLGDRQKQMSWILSNVTETAAKSHRVEAKARGCRRQFFLPIKEEDRRVCRTFFCATLNIAYNVILHAAKHRSNTVSMTM
ncbi:MAG: hypothetical protein GY696_29630 [Gammaproteobacteria bacterium]|nr:hypothetical protein [Gammaproteobacteria bacterium]